MSRLILLASLVGHASAQAQPFVVGDLDWDVSLRTVYSAHPASGPSAPPAARIEMLRDGELLFSHPIPPSQAVRRYFAVAPDNGNGPYLTVLLAGGERPAVLVFDLSLDPASKSRGPLVHERDFADMLSASLGVRGMWIDVGEARLRACRWETLDDGDGPSLDCDEP